MFCFLCYRSVICFLNHIVDNLIYKLFYSVHGNICVCICVYMKLNYFNLFFVYLLVASNVCTITCVRTSVCLLFVQHKYWGSSLSSPDVQATRSALWYDVNEHVQYYCLFTYQLIVLSVSL